MSRSQADDSATPSSHPRPIDVVLPRLAGTRKTARGWIARCPAHDDRSPSLSISISANESVLVHCFAGCDVSAILGAAGLSKDDLFVPRVAGWRARPMKAASDDAIRAFIAREIERERVRRLERYPFDTPHARSADVNAARARANALYARQLAPIAPYVWEFFAPHDSDPAWPELFAYACQRIAYDRHHFVNRQANCGDTAPLSACLYPLAADLAARWLHELAIGDSR